MTTAAATTKRQYTRQEVARFKAIAANKAGKPKAETPKTEGEVVKTKTFALAGVAPFNAIIGFTEQNSGTGTNGNAFTTLKGVDFMVDGVAYTRTCMAYGKGSDLVQEQLAGGATMLEVELTPNRNTMKITGIVVEGEYVAIADERPVEEEGRLAA